MWPFKRRLPRAYLIDVYADSRESRRTLPVETLPNGDHIIRVHGDDAIVLLPNGQTTGGDDRRWGVIDDIPGLTDGFVTPLNIAESLAKRCDTLEAQLKAMTDAARNYRDARTDRPLKVANARLTDALTDADILLSQDRWRVP